MNRQTRPTRLAMPLLERTKNTLHKRHFVGLICVASLLLSSCGQVKMPGAMGGGGGGNPPSKGGGGQQQHANNNPEEAAKNGMLNGDWRLGFKYNGQTFNASMTIKQTGSTFTGKGKEDESGNDFVITEGHVSGDQITFLKKYTGKSASMAPIEYAGSITTANEANYQGPYLSGDYSFKQNGASVTSDWDAVQDNGPAQAAAAAPSQPQEEQAPQQSQEPVEPSQNTSRPDKPPDLSGKWNVGFEYHFTTVHSVMFLEQDHNSITGHGIDDTKEKFTVEKGKYNFPKLEFVRKYAKGEPIKVKGKSHEGKPERSMMFRADVSIANDKDYQGPYLSGSTEGGGKWEAEEFK